MFVTKGTKHRGRDKDNEIVQTARMDRTVHYRRHPMNECGENSSWWAHLPMELELDEALSRCLMDRPRLSIFVPTSCLREEISPRHLDCSVTISFRSWFLVASETCKPEASNDKLDAGKRYLSFL